MSPSAETDARLTQLGGRLSERGRETIEKIEKPLEEGYELDQVAERLGVTRRDVDRARRELRDEAVAVVDGAQLSDLSADERQALIDSVAELTQLVPILVDEDGEVLDGRHRLEVCRELGIEPVTHTIETHGDPEIRRRIMLAANTTRRSLSAGARRRFIEAEILHDPKRSDRSIAVLLGVSHVTVGKVRAELEERGRVLRFDSRVGTDGVKQPVRPRENGGTSKPAEWTVTLGIEDEREHYGIAFAAHGARLFISKEMWAQLGEPAALEVRMREKR